MDHKEVLKVLQAWKNLTDLWFGLLPLWWSKVKLRIIKEALFSFEPGLYKQLVNLAMSRIDLSCRARISPYKICGAINHYQPESGFTETGFLIAAHYQQA